MQRKLFGIAALLVLAAFAAQAAVTKPTNTLCAYDGSYMPQSQMKVSLMVGGRTLNFCSESERDRFSKSASHALRVLEGKTYQAWVNIIPADTFFESMQSKGMGEMNYSHVPKNVSHYLVVSIFDKKTGAKVENLGHDSLLPQFGKVGSKAKPVAAHWDAMMKYFIVGVDIAEGSAYRGSFELRMAHPAKSSGKLDARTPHKADTFLLNYEIKKPITAGKK